MKVFTTRFAIGTVMVALGLFSLIVGLLLLLPPTNNFIVGPVLVLIGAILNSFGFKVAKDEVPAGSKTAIETLKRAKLLNKTHKN